MKSRGIFYKIKQNTKQNITHRRDEFTSRRRALLYCIRFCHSLLIMPKLSSLNPDRSAIPQKSATLSKVGTIRLYFRPPSTQLKPISIFLKGEFAAAHSRKVGTIRLYFRPPSTQLKPISIFLKGKFEAAHSRKVGTFRYIFVRRQRN